MMRKIYHEKDQWKIHNISNSRPTLCFRKRPTPAGVCYSLIVKGEMTV